MKAFQLSPVQKQIMKWFLEDEARAGSPVGKTRSMRKTYLALYGKGMIRPTAQKTFVLTTFGKEVAVSIRPRRLSEVAELS